MAIPAFSKAADPPGLTLDELAEIISRDPLRLADLLARAALLLRARYSHRTEERRHERGQRLREAYRSRPLPDRGPTPAEVEGAARRCEAAAEADGDE